MEQINLTLGSLFSGSGGFELAGLNCGITPIWASEIAPFPIRVTTKRMPWLKHYGDVTKMDGSAVEPADIITFGSPCQDMSIAGKRDGLDGSRSSLFYEAIRIVKEMREATNGRYPRYIVWENVPGAFSSNKGEDFRSVLEAVCSVKCREADIPRPEKWADAGEIMADGYSAAWRVLDAQYWGVPQRRKRIYLVADFDGQSAGKILFESESLRGDIEKSSDAGQGAAGAAKACAGETGICLNDQGGDRMDITQEVTGTLRSRMGGHQPCVMDAPCFDVRFTSEGTRNARANVYETETSRTIDTSGNSPDSNHGGIAVVGSAHEPYREETIAPTLNTDGAKPTHNQIGMTVVESYPLQGSMIGRDNKNGPQGSGISRDVSFTLNTADRHAVYAMTTGSHMQAIEDRAPALMARDFKDPAAVAYGIGQPTMVAKGPRAVQSGYAVRRLTPTECARLQGFPDGWCADLGSDSVSDEDMAFWRAVFDTNARISGTKPRTDNQIRKWLKNPHTDSAEYAMWGNGIALPCAEFVLSGIVHHAQQDAG